MNPRSVIVVILLFASAVLLFTGNVRGQSSAGEHKSVWSGVYTDEQATRGQALYEQACVNCHGAQLAGGASQGGPQLAGEKFIENWREDTVEDLFTKIRYTMPRRGFQGSDRVLTDSEALDLISYIFKRNNLPTGPELTTAGLGNLWIEQKDGPKPLPNYSQIQVIGCLEQDGDNWVLAKAAQPTRLRTSGEKVEPEVVKAAQAKPIGTLTFRLQNLVMLGAFNPESHKGHKMVGQGVLIRQGQNERISVTQLEMVSANCANSN